MAENIATEKPCPYCAELIKNEAVVCKHCGYNLSTGKPADWLIPEKQTTPQNIPQQVKARSSVGDGVRLGCGMFIVLPILLILFVIFLVAILGSH